jgi:hypothetical protein
MALSPPNFGTTPSSAGSCCWRCAHGPGARLFENASRRSINGDQLKRPPTRAVRMPWCVLRFITMMPFNSLELISVTNKDLLGSSDCLSPHSRPCRDVLETTSPNCGPESGGRKTSSEALRLALSREPDLAEEFGRMPSPSGQWAVRNRKRSGLGQTEKDQRGDSTAGKPPTAECLRADGHGRSCRPPRRDSRHAVGRTPSLLPSCASVASWQAPYRPPF